MVLGRFQMKEIKNKEEAIRFIFELYNEFKERGDVSWVDLSYEAKSQLLKWYIYKSDMIEYLKKNPAYVDVWEQHCQDQRSDGAYVFCYQHKKDFVNLEKDCWVFGYQFVKKNVYAIFDIDTEPFRLCVDYIYIQCNFEVYWQYIWEKDWWKYWTKFSKTNDVSSVSTNHWVDSRGPTDKKS
jgi:hypothetical protein